MRKILFVLALTLLALGWCIGTAHAADGDATIQFINATSGPAMFYIDQVCQGMLLAGDSKTVSVKSGRHHLVAVVSIDPLITKKHHVRIVPGQAAAWKILDN